MSSKKRWSRNWNLFKQRPTASLALMLLGLAIMCTLLSPFLANSRPLILSRDGHWYFPAMKDYHPTTLGLDPDILDINYREVVLKEGDWTLWPIIRWDPYESNKTVDTFPSPPTKDNWFGTDDRGRDVFTRLLYGLKYSLAYAIFVWMISFSFGTVAGGIMGNYGGKVDFVGQRLVEIISTVPQFFLLIILVSVFTPSLPLLILISSLFSWISISYYVRAEFLKNRKRDFVESARALGARDRRIIFKHILPNSLTPIITFSPFVIAANIVGLASLDYLGLGLTVPTPSWGELLAQAQKNYSVAWWLAVFPGGALFLTLTALNLIGEGIRDALDPNSRLR